MQSWRGIIEAYRSRLPVAKETAVVSLNEGNTPLIRAHNLERHLNARFRVAHRNDRTRVNASAMSRLILLPQNCARGDSGNLCQHG